MMHEPEKSDSAVVAAKPTNKAEQSAAEPAEPRAGTKGNAGQQSTRRAQDRGSVSQALERVRQAARQRKKEKFTVAPPPSRSRHAANGVFALKRDAAPGVDGLTWEAYETDLDRKIEDLHARVTDGAYRALAVPAEDIFRRQTEHGAHSRSRLSKIKSSRGRRLRC